MNFMVVTAVALWFDTISIIAHVIRMNTIISMVAVLVAASDLCTRKKHILSAIMLSRL